MYNIMNLPKCREIIETLWWVIDRESGGSGEVAAGPRGVAVWKNIVVGSCFFFVLRSLNI
jgi:hypothetical protein